MLVLEINFYVEFIPTSKNLTQFTSIHYGFIVYEFNGFYYFIVFIFSDLLFVVYTMITVY